MLLAPLKKAMCAGNKQKILCFTAFLSLIIIIYLFLIKKDNNSNGLNLLNKESNQKILPLYPNTKIIILSRIKTKKEKQKLRERIYQNICFIGKRK